MNDGAALGLVLDQVSKDKNIDRAVLVETLEQAILTAAKRAFGMQREMEAKFNEQTGRVDLFQIIVIVDQITPGNEGKEVPLADAIPHAYQLEVSSPGLDRPLRRERDFARFVGETARIRLVDGVEGRRNFSGTLRAAHDGRVEIACDGRSYELPIDDIVRANLVPDWDREFHRSAS